MKLRISSFLLYSVFAASVVAEKVENKDVEEYSPDTNELSIYKKPEKPLRGVPTKSSGNNERHLPSWVCEQWGWWCPDDPPKVGEFGSCASRACQSGLFCDPTFTVCLRSGREGSKCDNRSCADDLICDSSTDVCLSSGRRHGDLCDTNRPCGAGYRCAVESTDWTSQICIPDCMSYSDEMSKKLHDVGHPSSSWPGAGEKWDGGIVPFEADCSLEEHELLFFSIAMHHIEQDTSIRFVRYDDDVHSNYIILTDARFNRASSFVGKLKVHGWQRVNLDTREEFHVFGRKAAIHELVHALGWPHTQSRPDRDFYVTIEFDNINADAIGNFNVDDSSDVYKTVQQCRPYNYGSIMHYPDNLFSINDEEVTITTKDSAFQNVIGTANGLNAQDMEEIQEYYFEDRKCCTDSPLGWYDSDGPTYDCAWYSKGTRCEDYGDDFADANGITANFACCACGGGEHQCQDSPLGWFDRDGAIYDCAWYSQGTRCEDLGSFFADANGITANMACCACGGGTDN